MKLLISKFSPVFFYLLHFRSQYLPHHTILEYPLPIYFHQSDGPDFITLWKQWKNYSSAYFSLYTFGEETGRDKIMDRFETGISRFQSALIVFTIAIMICLGSLYLRMQFVPSSKHPLSVICTSQLMLYLSAVSTRPRNICIT